MTLTNAIPQLFELTKNITQVGTPIDQLPNKEEPPKFYGLPVNISYLGGVDELNDSYNATMPLTTQYFTNTTSASYEIILQDEKTTNLTVPEAINPIKETYKNVSTSYCCKGD